MKRGFRVEATTERVELPNGTLLDLDIVRHPGAAAVVPFVSEHDVLLIRQYRHAAGGMILEVPAGKLDPGEAPDACAARELAEEAGQRARASAANGRDLDDARLHGRAHHPLRGLRSRRRCRAAPTTTS